MQAYACFIAGHVTSELTAMSRLGFAYLKCLLESTHSWFSTAYIIGLHPSGV